MFVNWNQKEVKYLMVWMFQNEGYPYVRIAATIDLPTDHKIKIYLEEIYN